MYDPSFTPSNDSHAVQVLGTSKAEGVTLFVFDQAATTGQPVSYLYNRDVDPGVLNAYASELYRDDALLPMRASPQSRFERFTGINCNDKKALRQHGLKARSGYWGYLSSFGYQETAASFKSISSNLYLVIGLHCTKPGKHIDIDAAGQRLEHWLEEVEDQLIEGSIRKALNTQYSNKQYSEELPALSFERSPATPAIKFTRREYQVVCELLKGQSNKQIAYALSITEYGVQNHLRRLYRKFSVRSRTEFIAKLHTLNWRP